MGMDVRSLPAGTLVHNRYRVEQVLGAGGFGITYKVRDQKNGQIAAMKEYMPRDIAHRSPGSSQVRPLTEGNRSQYEKFYNQFLQEAQTIYSLRGHPNIVEITHLFYENNTVYYVMEYVEGLDLKQYLRQQGGRLRWEAARPLIEQVVRGLSQVHASGLIHCDISPDNIFLMKNGQIKLLDFGTARSMLRGEVQTSVILAKPGFSPYEQMRGKGMGPWTDVYALAVTIYCCITGKVIPDSTERMIQDKTIWPSQMGLAIPSKNFEQVLKKALAVKPEERYQSVAQFWKELAGSGMSAVQPSRPQSQRYPQLQGIQGVFANRSLSVSRELCLGVDPSRCHVLFPLGTPGISKLHLRIWPDSSGALMVMDMGSTYGTMLNGGKLQPGTAYKAAAGSVLHLGGGQVFRVV